MRLMSAAMLLIALHPALVLAQPKPVPTGDRELMAVALEHTKRNEAETMNYTFTSVHTVKGRGWFNRIIQRREVAETYQTLLRPIRVVLELDGKPLPPNEIEKQRQLAVLAMERDEVEAKAKKLEGRLLELEYGTRFRSIYFSIFDLFRRMDFHNRRLEALNGRPSLVLDFQPKSTNGPTEHGKAYLDHLWGRIWVDQEDLLPARVRVYRSPQTPQPGAHDEVWAMDYTKQANRKWLCSYGRINTMANPKLFTGQDFDMTFTLTDFQEFSQGASSIYDVSIQPPTGNAASSQTSIPR